MVITSEAHLTDGLQGCRVNFMQEWRLGDAVILAAKLNHSDRRVVREHLVESKLVS